ncbi:MAG: hypothetical protein KGI84_09235, partial [Elusimicrobia bacterium]|nr:hypothetical protein [Elusimicrobiota bacterium]
PDEALSAWEEMRAAKPANSPFRLQALINLAQAYEKTGSDAKAISVYDDLALSAGKPLAEQAAARAKALRKLEDAPASVPAVHGSKNKKGGGAKRAAAGQ